YSFLGRDPVGWLRLGDGPEDPAARGGPVQRPLDALRKSLVPFRPVRLPDLPRFVGGAVGFPSCDLARPFARLPRGAPAGLGIPILACGLYDTVVAFDHLRQRLQIVTLVPTERQGRPLRGGALLDSWKSGRRRIEAIVASLRRPLRRALPSLRRPGRWRAS